MNIKDIDRQIGMPDVDKEWARFEQEVIDKAPHIGVPRPKQQMRYWRAAMIALVSTLGFVALASAFYLGVWRAPSEPDSVPPAAEVQPVEVQAGAGCFEFDEVEMEEVMRTLCQHYAMQAVFRNEASKHVRLYITLPEDYTPVEVADLINTFESVHITMAGDTFYIE